MKTPAGILSARWLIAAGAAGLIAAACGPAPPSPPVRVDGRLNVKGLPPVDVRIDVRPEHAREAARYLSAALATLKMCGQWLGPYPASSLAIAEPGRRVEPPAPPVQALEPVPLVTLPWSMTIELATARAVSRAYWSSRLGAANLPGWFVDGLVEIAARRAVEPLFQMDNLPPGYAFMEARFFGGFVPKFLRIRLKPETDGEPLPPYRATPAVTPVTEPRSPGVARVLAAKTVLTLGTLERWIGRPVFDEAVAQFVRSSAGRQPTLADFVSVASEVSGQNLSWLFDQTLASSGVFDYALDRLTSDATPDGLFLTTVIVHRYGDALFTGASAPPVGPFESGRGIALQTVFADGTRRIDYWDGRGRTRQFTYRGQARAVSAEVDPDRIVLLDMRSVNNSRSLSPRAGVAATKWSARWLVWLEDWLLTCALLS